MGLVGVGVMIVLGLALSYNRRAVRWKLVGIGVLVQIAMAGIILKVPGFREAFQVLGAFVNRVIQMSQEGIKFVFSQEFAKPGPPWGFVFAVQVLPIIIFFSALMSLLYYLGVMQKI